jgi:hypothetical protein
MDEFINKFDTRVNVFFDEVVKNKVTYGQGSGKSDHYIVPLMLKIKVNS